MAKDRNVKSVTTAIGHRSIRPPRAALKEETPAAQLGLPVWQRLVRGKPNQPFPALKLSNRCGAARRLKGLFVHYIGRIELFFSIAFHAVLQERDKNTLLLVHVRR